MILSPLPCCLIPSLCTRMAEQYRRCRATYTPTRHTTRTSVRPLRLLGCPMAVHGSGPLRRRGNVDNVAAAHDFCGAHADCSQQGCGQKMFERLWPVIGRRASFGRYCITTKMTHRGTWCSGIRLLWLSLSVLARQLGRRPGPWDEYGRSWFDVRGMWLTRMTVNNSAHVFHQRSTSKEDCGGGGRCRSLRNVV